MLGSGNNNSSVDGGLPTPATTPTKRKHSSRGGGDDEYDQPKAATPSKRARKQPKPEFLEGVPFADSSSDGMSSSNSRHVKFDHHDDLAMAATTIDPFASYQQQGFMQPEFFLPVNSQIKDEISNSSGISSSSSGCSSFVG